MSDQLYPGALFFDELEDAYCLMLSAERSLQYMLWTYLVLDTGEIASLSEVTILNDDQIRYVF